MDKYGLIGRHLAHSFSKKYFSDKFDNQHIDLVYINYELNDISEITSVFEDKDLCGLNVTIPYKESVIEYLDELSPVAQQVGAVNTIQFQEGRKIGHNTDVFGFKQMIKPFFRSEHERGLILGTGGASKAVSYVLEELGVDLIFVSRNPKGLNQYSYDDINANMISFNKIIVNTTPIGMYPHIDQLIPIPYDALTADHLVIDLIYNPLETLFLQKAAEKGAKILNGETMLKQQAEEAWRIWNNK